MMTIKDYLNRARILDAQINRHLHELEYWRGISRGLSGCGYEAGGSTNRSSEPVFVKCAGIIIELEKNINYEIDELIEVKNSILVCIQHLDSLDHCKVLELRYISSKVLFFRNFLSRKAQ